jgi:Skp family chaperone for outer membrane proteins
MIVCQDGGVIIKLLLFMMFVAACGKSSDATNAANPEACLTSRKAIAAAWDGTAKQIDAREKLQRSARLRYEMILKIMSGDDASPKDSKERPLAKTALDSIYAEAEAGPAAQKAATDAAAAWSGTADAKSAQQLADGNGKAYGDALQKSSTARSALADELRSAIRTVSDKIGSDDPRRKEVEALVAEQRKLTDEMTKELEGDRKTLDDQTAALRARLAKLEIDGAAALTACK